MLPSNRGKLGQSIPRRNIFLFIAAAGRPNPAFGKDAEDFQKYWIEESRKLSRLSTAGDFILAESAGHHIHQDAPDLVLAAIRRLLK
jgi:hypothetical protein